jgi:hypothetical protein
VAQPTQPASQSAAQQAVQQYPPLNNVEPETHEEPALADDAVGNDLTAEEQAEREADELQEGLLKASAAQDRAEKQQAAEKKKREAADRESAKKRQEAKKQAERAEAARMEQEEADRKEVIEKEAAKKEVAEKLKAAQKQKAAEEAAHKQAEEEARGRQIQQQKLAEETARREAAEREAAEKKAAEKAAADAQKLAQERKLAEEKKKAAEQAARQKAADEERLAQEKLATEAKAAQEKEQAAAKAKASQDEAAKIKAAAQKKADDGVAAFKKAEEEAKLEKVRQAKEQKEKEAKELEEKELRGLKRPGVKRAAPQTDDQANKKAKTDDCKQSCKDFEEGLKLAKFKFSGKPPKAPDGPVKFGSHLNLDTIFQALASVTEAINDACVKDSQGKIWGLFHPRSLVDFDIVDHPVVLHRHEALVPIQRRAGKKTHFSLIALVQTEVASRHGRDYFAIHHYDCDPSLRQAFINTIAKTTVRSQILAAGWAGSNKGDIETPLGKSENADCCDRLPGAEQEWTTGIHAVLNGWVCALKLKHNKNALLSKEGFYEKAVDLINLAIRKHITSKTILNFFDCYEYVLKDDLTEEDRHLRTFSETKDFETYARLDKYILALLGRKPRVDVDEITGTGPRTVRTPVTEKPLGSGRPTGDYAPSNLDAFLKGADGPAGMPEDEKETDDAEEPKQGPVDDDGYDSARSNNDEDDIDDVDEEGNAILEEEIVVEEPEQLFDWRGKAITEETRRAEAAARAAAKEKLAQAKREREEREAAEAAARAKAAEPDDTDKSLFGEDDDEDMGNFYNSNEPPPNDQAAPTSAPQHENAQDDPDEDLYGTSRSPQRQAQPQPSLQPTVVDEEEDLYTASPPRNRNPPPAAASAFNLNLNLPRQPPPTPHDPYAVNGKPFLFPTMYDQVPQPAIKPSFNLVVENGPVLPPPMPPPKSSNTVPASIQVPRQFTNPNPHGTFTVPDLPSDSDESPDDNPTAQPKTTQHKPMQTNGAVPNAQSTKPKPAAAKPTEPDLDEEAAWEAAGFTRRDQSPGLEAAMAEYDDDDADVDNAQLEDPTSTSPTSSPEKSTTAPSQRKFNPGTTTN